MIAKTRSLEPAEKGAAMTRNDELLAEIRKNVEECLRYRNTDHSIFPAFRVVDLFRELDEMLSNNYDCPLPKDWR